MPGMSSSLLETVFLSEKRKNLLLLLNKEGPKSSDDIKKELKFPWKSMIPQIKKLMDWGLLIQEDRMYALSDMGKIIATNAQFFLNTLATYEENRDFWSEHDLTSIPFHLRSRIGELGHCEVLETDPSQAFKVKEDVIKSTLASNRIMTFVSVFHPVYPLLCSEFLEKEKDITVLVTGSFFETLQDDCKSILDSFNNNSIFKMAALEYKREIEQFLNSKASNFFVYEGEKKPVAMAITDTDFFLSLLDKNGRLTNRLLKASGPEALRWGEELFMYYKGQSRQVFSF